MGLSQSSPSIEFESPSKKHTATLYYFAGRGMADQIRWMLAATEVNFCQKTVSNRDKFLEMASCQLPFGQIPLLQIDGIEIVQSQASVRYLARRGNLMGKNSQEMVKCDMIAEAVRDVLMLLLAVPFRKYSSAVAATTASTSAKEVPVPATAAEPTRPRAASAQESAPPAAAADVIVNVKEWEAHLKLIQDKWAFVGGRLEAILADNLPAEHPALRRKAAAATRALAAKKAVVASQKGKTVATVGSSSSASNGTAVAPAASSPSSGASGDRDAQQAVQNPEEVHIVGNALTYADVLVAHLVTWLVEEVGPGAVESMPLLVQLQNQVISLPGVKQFIRSVNYFPIGDSAYVRQVGAVPIP
jgi:glutathione S-transferase